MHGASHRSTRVAAISATLIADLHVQRWATGAKREVIDVCFHAGFIPHRDRSSH
jgi:hypothetical protein